MINNVVFDLGNVLISFDPEQYLIMKNYPPGIRNTILNDIFHSEEWLKLDNGDITTKEATDSIASRSVLKREEISVVFNFRSDIMYPIDSNVQLLPALKKNNIKLYYLSNFPLDVFDEIKSDYYFFRYFDGGIISSEAKLSKPDLRFYKLIMDKYALVPDESLYIDDLEINVRAAEAAGMKGFSTFGNQNIAPDILNIIASYK
ncbi:MAG: HAD family phosphatase [Bacteroidales bacterium]|jgi:putative hydrolase of the HAD superfamily|nr:HAD family phosphatase [Bacteroidales bacterium]